MVGDVHNLYLFGFLWEGHHFGDDNFQHYVIDSFRDYCIHLADNMEHQLDLVAVLGLHDEGHVADIHVHSNVILERNILVMNNPYCYPMEDNVEWQDGLWMNHIVDYNYGVY